MMRTHTMPASVTLLIVAVVLAAPLVTNIVLAMTHEGIAR